MADKEFSVRKGLIVANTLIYATGANVGIGNTTPTHNLRVEGTQSVLTSISVGNSSVNVSINATSFSGTSNNSTNLGGTAAAGYQTTAGLSSNVATLTANNTSFVGSVSAANVVSNAQLSANLSSYQTIAGLSANVATLTANNASNLGGVAASGYQTTAGLSANVATLTANNANNLGGSAANTYAKLSGAIFTGQITANGATTYGVIGYTSNASVAGVLGYSQNQTKYGILGYQNAWAFYGAGDGYFAGNFYSTGNITAYYSDKRLKQDIVKIKDSIDIIKQISGVYYKQNEIAKQYGFDSEETQIGVIAQEIQKVIPQAVAPAPFDTDFVDGKIISKSGENYLTVLPDKIIPVLIEAIKKLDERLSAIEQRLE